MRVIAGEYRGRKLRAVKGDKTRPTADRVKEALFNILQNKIYGISFLDLYSGTGNIAIEALSRGAEKVVLVEEAKAALAVIEQNLTDLSLYDTALVLPQSVESAIGLLGRREQSFDIIFADPPYKFGKEEELMTMLQKHHLLKEDGIFIIEHSRKNDLPEVLGEWKKTRDAAYGDTALAFYRYS